MSSPILHEAAIRRTFAIISHPDAGKTTLTEKLLLYGGAIREAGAVKSRKAGKAALSDWMAIEQERGISVTSSVLRFEKDGIKYNLLDTPGHKDFSEDTLRTLVAADCALMVIDVAKGVETQTEKLYEDDRRDERGRGVNRTGVIGPVRLDSSKIRPPATGQMTPTPRGERR